MARRRKQSASQELVGAVIIVASIAAAVVLALIGVVLSATFDVCALAWARLRGHPTGGFRVTRGLLLRVTHRRAFRTGHRRAKPQRIHVESLGALLALSATGFEEAVAQSLRDSGYRDVVRKGGPGDLGVDITCIDPSGERLAIQCKRYAPGKQVGSRDVQLFIGMTHTEHDVDRGVFVTTSDFTVPARALASRHGIRLIDGRGLIEIFGFEAPPVLAVEVKTPVPPTLMGTALIEAERNRETALAEPRQHFCAMSEDELKELETIAQTHEVQWAAEVVRPLDNAGERGMRFETFAEMTRTADLIELAVGDAQLQTERFDFQRRARLAVVVAMLRNGGERSYEVPRVVN